LIVVGVISDTHIPDRVNRLHPQVIPSLRERGVSVILHAGDISVPSVLDELSQVAPVSAVRGNRDLVFGTRLPWYKVFRFNGCQVALMHGHGSWVNYWIDKLSYHKDGYRLERYLPVLMNTVPEADVVVFGHTHYPEINWKNRKLLFNPGSACAMIPHLGLVPSIGLLRINEMGKVEAEIIRLQGACIEKHKWVKASDIGL
jgi:putative phosphoesterase